MAFATAVLVSLSFVLAHEVSHLVNGDRWIMALALARLDETRGAPGDDLCEWSDALIALDVHPTLSSDGTFRGWAFRTHPSTEARIDRLQQLAVEMERD